MITIQQLNDMSLESFTETLADIFEHSPWIARETGKYRPFSSIQSLHEKMKEVVEDLNKEDKLALAKAHPQLGARDKMSFTSTAEQKGAGLNQLSEEEFEQFVRLNESYVCKFGFPFIMAVKGKTKRDIYESLQERLENGEEEFQKALTEIFDIARFRLEEKITE